MKKPKTILAALLTTVLGIMTTNAETLYVANWVFANVGTYDGTTGTPLNPTLVSVGLHNPDGIGISGNKLYVADAYNGTVGVYDAITGIPINTTLISGFTFGAVAVTPSGGNLFVTTNNLVGLYDATTGAAISPNFVSLTGASGTAVYNGILYVGSTYYGTISQYDATTGALINPTFVSGLNSGSEGPQFITISGGFLYVTYGYNSVSGVGKFDATTGLGNPTFILLHIPRGIAVSGDNVYVAYDNGNTVGLFDAITGTSVNPTLITGLGGSTGFEAATGLAVVESYSAQVQQPINADGSSVFNVRRGVVPVKFTLTLNGTSTCTLPPATIALTRISGATTGIIDESIYGGPADTGSNFRIDSCQYIYNLSANALGVGTYRIDILINGQVVGSGTFQLK